MLVWERYFWCYVIPVNVDQWCAGIRRFHSCLVILKTKKKLSDPVIIFKCIYTFFYNVLILKAGDIELNPGPPKNLAKWLSVRLWTKWLWVRVQLHSYFSCFHWNVNSLATDNYSKVVALKAYNSIYKYRQWNSKV